MSPLSAAAIGWRSRWRIFRPNTPPAREASGGIGSAAPTIHVHLLAVLGGSRDRRVLGHFEANERRPAAENRVAAIVEAYDQAVDAALAHLVVETSAVLSGDLAPH